MKSSRSNTIFPASAAALAVALTVAACGKGPEQVAQASSNSLLDYVPNDTPYLAGNLQPFPEDVIEANFARVQPGLDALQEVLKDSSVKLSGSAAEENPEIALMGAILGELNGKLNRQGIESLGFTMSANHVVYGMGAFPVMRLSLGDAQALRDTIARIETNASTTFPQSEFEGQGYWKLSGGGSDAEAPPAPVYFAIIGEGDAAHLAIGAIPQNLEATLLPQFLGKTLPDNSVAAESLAEINSAYGYSPYASGFLDFQKMLDQFTDPNSPVGAMMAANGRSAEDVLGATCQAEISELISRTPRLVAGVTDLTAATTGAEYRLEMADDLASDLASLVSNVPPVPAQTSQLLEFSLGIRVGAARDFLITKATEYSQKQYQCDKLASIPQSASELLESLNYPLPPLINNFLGFRASISDLPEDQSQVADVKGTFALHVDKPEMFVGMAQMFLPQIAGLEIEKGAPPQEIPQELMPMPGMVASTAMSDHALGFAVGAGEEQRLVAYLEEDTPNDGSFFSVNYDMAAYMQKLNELQDNFETMMGAEGMGADGEQAYIDAQNDPIVKLSEAWRKSFMDMAGRSELSLHFDSQGFAVRSRMQFND